jgi:hypothetical protein
VVSFLERESLYRKLKVEAKSPAHRPWPKGKRETIERHTLLSHDTSHIASRWRKNQQGNGIDSRSAVQPGLYLLRSSNHFGHMMPPDAVK